MADDPTTKQLVDGLIDQIDALRQQATAANATLGQDMQNLGNLQGTAAPLDAAVQKAQQDLDAATANVAAVQTQGTASVQAAQSAADAANKAAQDAVTAAQTTLQTAQQAAAQTDASLASAQSQVTADQQVVAAIEAQIPPIQQKIQDAVASLDT
jgi:chromosome segregation ATPase